MVSIGLGPDGAAARPDPFAAAAIPKQPSAASPAPVEMPAPTQAQAPVEAERPAAAPAQQPIPPEAAAPAAPQATPARAAAPGRVSIGLSDEALGANRPTPATQPAARPLTRAQAVAAAVTAASVEAERASAQKPEKPRPKSRMGLVFSMLFLMLVILGGGYFGSQWLAQAQNAGTAPAPGTAVAPPAPKGRDAASQDAKAWQEEAKQVLSEFLAAETPTGKAAFSIRGSELLPQMIAFYGRGPIDDSDTPLSGFASANLPAEDHKRGIYRMGFDCPPQFEMKDFFGPLASLEVQMKVEEPDLLLSSLARAGNFTSDPVKVDVFFKRTPEGLKIDWETFVQTKHRLFQSFTELPDPGRSGVFRVFVMEDVPEKGRATLGHKTYKIVDPAYRTDFTRVEVAVDSELGRALSKVNWLGVKDSRPITKTATLELEWTREASPRLAIKRFLCWEFLGIGGEAIPVAPKSGQ